MATSREKIMSALLRPGQTSEWLLGWESAGASCVAPEPGEDARPEVVCGKGSGLMMTIGVVTQSRNFPALLM